MNIPESVQVQLIVTIGGFISAIIAYIISTKRDKKRREEKDEDYRREMRQEASNRVEAQTDKIMSRLDRIEDKVDDLYKYQDTNSEAISLMFESDMIQFEAFRRSGLLNGESERQEQKMNEFLQKKLKMNITPKGRD